MIYIFIWKVLGCPVSWVLSVFAACCKAFSAGELSISPAPTILMVKLYVLPTSLGVQNHSSFMHAFSRSQTLFGYRYTMRFCGLGSSREFKLFPKPPVLLYMMLTFQLSLLVLVATSLTELALCSTILC